MIAISDRLYASFIGPNWTSHYRAAFSKLEGGAAVHPFRSWNTAAALVPFWFVYRGLTSWSIIFFLLSLLLFATFSIGFTLLSWMRPNLYLLPFVPAYLCVSIVQGGVADALLRRKALGVINEIRRKAPDEGAAVRALSSYAPRGREGGLVAHGVVMLVGLPLWIVAVLSGARALAPQYSEPQSVYVTLMRSALRDVSVLQESFFSVTARYGGDLEEIGFQATRDIAVHIVSASDSGWRAVASHPMVVHSCTIFVGRVSGNAENDEEGVPDCPTVER